MEKLLEILFYLIDKQVTEAGDGNTNEVNQLIIQIYLLSEIYQYHKKGDDKEVEKYVERYNLMCATSEARGVYVYHPTFDRDWLK